MKTKYMREEQLKAMVDNLKNLNNLLTIENETLKRELKKLKHLL